MLSKSTSAFPKANVQRNRSGTHSNRHLSRPGVVPLAYTASCPTGSPKKHQDQRPASPTAPKGAVRGQEASMAASSGLFLLVLPHIHGHWIRQQALAVPFSFALPYSTTMLALRERLILTPILQALTRGKTE